MEKLISDIKNDINLVIEDISTAKLSKLLKYASDKYYNDTEILTDQEYDLLYDTLKKKSPKNKFFKEIGSEVSAKNKVKLPFHMGSMDKKKPNTGEILKWTKKYKGKYVISDKLDGISGLFVVKDNEKNLYTRGDGTFGTDISSLIPYISDLNRDFDKDFVLRGEFIIKKKTFKKYEENFSNPRSLVNGIINKKKPIKEELKDIDFVIYENINNEKLSNQMKAIKKLGFKLVEANLVDKIDDNILCKLFETRKKKSIYDIDGLVITDNNIHERNKSGNPKYAFAFKDTAIQDFAIVDVLDVEWNISKDDLMKPRIKVKPTKLSGVEINYVTGFNAKYIVDNNIGKNTKLKIIRSGDVIPHILDVVKSTKASMPDVKYKWNESNVDILIDESSKDIDKEKLIKQLTYFLKKLNIKNIDSKLVEKFIDNKINTIPKLLKAKDSDFLKIEGIKETMAKKIYDNIQNNIKSVNLPVLMTASNIFGQGFGIKKFEAITKVYPDILEKKENISDLIIKIDGFEKKTADKFALNLPKFKSFLKTVPMITISYTKASGDKLKNLKIVFSGFRDSSLEDKIKSEGGNVVNTVSNNTKFLLVKSLKDSSSKIDKAKELKIKILTLKQFVKKFNL